MLENFHGHKGDVFSVDVHRWDAGNIFVSAVSFFSFKVRIIVETLCLIWQCLLLFFDIFCSSLFMATTNLK